MIFLLNHVIKLRFVKIFVFFVLSFFIFVDFIGQNWWRSWCFNRLKYFRLNLVFLSIREFFLFLNFFLMFGLHFRFLFFFFFYFLVYETLCLSFFRGGGLFLFHLYFFSSLLLHLSNFFVLNFSQFFLFYNLSCSGGSCFFLNFLICLKSLFFFFCCFLSG